MSNEIFNHVMDIVERYTSMLKEARSSGNHTRANELQNMIDELLNKCGISHSVKVA